MESNFLSELKRRRVYRVALGYLVVGWAVVQVGATLLPAFAAPPWALRTVIVLLALGFPMALLFAWAFDVTTHGLRATADGPATPALRRYFWSLGAAGVVVAALAGAGALYWFGTRGLSIGGASEKSIAVLPFASLSENKENAYFAEGIQDEILTRLSKIADLKVISRTSTERYKSKPEDVKAIGHELGAAHILEGTVQRAGSQVRVNVQLIDTRTDSHLWAETYSRELTDIFAVESEIARTIADSLGAKLTGKEAAAIAAQPTANPAAYDAYLRGIVADARGIYSFERLEQAARYFAQATQLDPQFALAWARLSRVDAFLYFRRQDTTPARRAAAQQALENAERIAPDAAETLIARAYFTYWILRDYDQARALFLEAGKRAPGASDVAFALSSIARRQGRWEESLAQSSRAIDLSPRDLLLLTERGWTLKIIRRFDDALAVYDRALEIVPNDPDLLASKAAIYQAQGDLDDARHVLAPLRPQLTEGAVANAIIAQGFLEKRYPDATAQLEELLAQPDLSRSSAESYGAWLGLAQQLQGQAAAALATNNKVRAQLEAHVQQEPQNEDVAALLAQVYAALGNKERALAEAKRAVALLPRTVDHVLGPGYEENLASVEAQIGDATAAIALLERLLATPEINGTSIVDAPLTPARLRLEPTWEKLRADERFARLTQP